MFSKTSILWMIVCGVFILAMAQSKPTLSPQKTWNHFRNFLEQKGEFAPEVEEKPEEESAKYVIVTGGANGTDVYAELLGRAYYCQVQVIIGPRHPRATTIPPLQLTALDVLFARRALLQASKVLQRNMPVQGNYTEELLIRNYFIAQKSTALYAFGRLESNNKTVTGGTGWTVQLTLDLGKKVYLFNLEDNQWYGFVFFDLQEGSYQKVFQFRPYGHKLTLNHHAGIVGTRQLTDQGRQEMRNLFQRSFVDK